MHNLREDFYRACLRPYSGRFANGEQANNKIDAERIRTLPELRGRVSRAVARTAMKFHPDMIIAVPDGANWLAIDIAWRLGTGIVLLHKDPDTKEISYYPGGQEAIETADRLLIVEDVFNRFTNTKKVFELPGVKERAVGAAAILDRGDPKVREDVNLPHDAYFREYIPARMSDSSKLWGYTR